MKFKKIPLLAATLITTAALALTGCGGGSSGSNPTIDGIDGPHVTFVNGVVSLSMVFKNVTIDGSASLPIPKYPNSGVQIGPDFQSGGTILTVSVNGGDFLGNQGAGLDPQTLPGGRPLPGVAAGSLPAIAMEIPSLHNSVFYFGPEVIGLFVPFDKLDLAGAIVTFRFYDSTNNPVGTISTVGSDALGKNAGILMLMDPALLGIGGNSARLAKMKKYYEMGYRK